MTYGYEMRNDTVIVNPSEAAVIRKIYKNYISGMSFSMSAKNAGLNIAHGSVKRLLLKKCYFGDNFYPAIIDKETYLKAYDRMMKNTFTGHKRRKEAVIHTEFEMDIPTQSFEDPFEQAEYIYSLIGVK